MTQHNSELHLVDPHVRAATGRRMRAILAELDTHRKKIETLHDELFILWQQYDWVNECNGLPCNIDMCSKCGATDA
jgi:hypothetical protein